MVADFKMKTYKIDDYYYYDYKNSLGDVVKGITEETYDFIQSLEPYITLHPALPFDSIQSCKNIKDKYPCNDPFERLKAGKRDVFITFKLCSDGTVHVLWKECKDKKSNQNI